MALNSEGLLTVPGILSRYVRLENGARAHYMTAGETGPAVILIHGGLAGSSGLAGWRFMMPYLAQNGFRVFAPDRPGYGFADTREEHWPKQGWKSYTDYMRMFVDALCLDRFHIGGNSMGAQTSIYFMLNHPERVISAPLIATGGIGGFAGVPADKLERSTALRDAGPFDGTKESMFRMLDAITYRKEALVDDVLEMRSYAARMQVDSLAAAKLQAPPETSSKAQWLKVSGRLSEIDIPTIYVHGLQDASAPVSNAKLAEPLLSNIQFFYPDECGHQCQTDQPDMLNEVFLEFLRDGKVSRKTADWAGVSKARPEIGSLVEQGTAAAAG
jgi:2-hydroxy-6-oxonona-2,4-dienedioate hydrolase